MGVVLVAASWCGLSLLFAGVHRRWVWYAPASVPGLRRVGAVLLRVGDPQGAAPEGSEVSEFFRSYRCGAGARPISGRRVPASRL